MLLIVFLATAQTWADHQLSGLPQTERQAAYARVKAAPEAAHQEAFQIEKANLGRARKKRRRGWWADATTVRGNWAGSVRPRSVDSASLRVALAITVTSLSISGTYQDGAAVLAHSAGALRSRHRLDLVALVRAHPDSTARAPLQRLGYRVIEAPVPVRVSEIAGTHLRRTIDEGYSAGSKSPTGCCGIAELLKLHGYLLVEFDRVLLLDADAILLQALP
jgi:hypothetical protein